MSDCIPRISLEAPADMDAPPFKLETLLDLCGLFILGIAFVLGMFAGGLLVAFFRAELSQLYWAALNLWY